MVLKIDLEKTYDKLEWNFIRDMLIRVNLPMDIIDVIMSCVSTVSTSILFNREALNPIYPSRGIRQGDPIFPYLSILYMDYLGQLIEEKCSGKLWQRVKASQSGPAFSHLFFADDLILLPKLMGLTVRPLEMFWILFVAFLGVYRFSQEDSLGWLGEGDKIQGERWFGATNSQG